jgi:hypothetical protein
MKERRNISNKQHNFTPNKPGKEEKTQPKVREMN